MKLCYRCKLQKPETQFNFACRKTGKRNQECQICQRARNVLRNRALRVAVLTHYSKGTPTCACCHETTLEFLSLDHIHGGGYQQRKAIRGSWWMWLRRMKYPEGFRVLCHNCNQAYGMYGYCPHQGSEERLAVAFRTYDPNAINRSYRLTQDQFKMIQADHANGVPQNQLATRFKVSRATICLIVNGKRGVKPYPSATNPSSFSPGPRAAEKRGRSATTTD